MMAGLNPFVSRESRSHISAFDTPQMLSRIYRYVLPTSTKDSVDAQSQKTIVNADEHDVTVDEEVADLTFEFEGDSLIIDELKSGPIQDLVVPQQYGTSFADASDYSTNSSFKIVKFNSDADIFSGWNKKNDYEVKISKFYLPSIKKQRESLNDIYSDLLQKDKYRFSIEDELKTIEDEIKDKLSIVTPLLPAQYNKVSSVLQNRNPSTVVISKFQIDVTVKDLKTLLPGKWLNDNIIDYYFNLIASQDETFFSWTSHFFTTLKSRGYVGVKRWGKRKKLNPFEKTIIFIPINISSTHWALAIVNNRDKTIGYYDSLNSLSQTSDCDSEAHDEAEFSDLHYIKTYLEGEVERLGLNEDVSQYKLKPNIKVPQQKNGYDCGVFTCICASYIAKSLKLTYKQDDMPIFRQRIAYEILNGILL